MKLHYAEVLNPRKVCAFAKHVGVDIDYVRVDLAKGAHLRPDFRALNPNAKVPVLEDGDMVLWEADAILCHLAMCAGSDLWPSDGRQVDVIRWLSWNQVHFQPLGGVFYFENVIKPMFGVGAPDQEKVAASVTPFRRFARVLDEHLTSRRWLVGDAPTISDFSLGTIFAYADKAQLPVGDCPAILRWHDRLNAFEAWRNPFPALAAAA